MYRILMYRNQRGDQPVEDYLGGLEWKHRRKIATRLELLAQEGPDLKRPYADVVQRPIRELRVALGRLQHRILYYFVIKDAVVLLHAFAKKTQKAPTREIQVAQERMIELNRRLAAGEVLE